MNASEMPKTTVRQVLTLFDDAIRLDGEDGVPEALHKGLYDAPADKLVVICQGDEVIALVSAGKLRGETLTRSWQAPLKNEIGSLSATPEVSAGAPVAEVGFLVQMDHDLEWVLVVDEDSGEPVGALDRATIERFLPPLDFTQEAYRATEARLWGDAQVKHYYYCPIEDKAYGAHAVRPDAEGRMRDRKDHLVERRELT